MFIEFFDVEPTYYHSEKFGPFSHIDVYDDITGWDNVNQTKVTIARRSGASFGLGLMGSTIYRYFSITPN